MNFLQATNGTRFLPSQGLCNFSLRVGSCGHRLLDLLGRETRQPGNQQRDERPKTARNNAAKNLARPETVRVDAGSSCVPAKNDTTPERASHGR
jgi:hypothetical protein